MRPSKQDVKTRLREKLSSKQGPKKICLTMIVKNESRNMPRLLESVKKVVDMISIVDTGSTDNTKEIILDWGKEHKIPTVVHDEPFKNFAHNRTHSVQAAKKAFPDANFFLLSDADFVWEIGKFDKSLLIDHKYLVEQYNGILRYWNIRLLSAEVDWECVGVTHEYWSECKVQSSYFGQVRTSKISTLVINDKEDGGCKTDKFIRDERLLREGLEDKDTPQDLKTRYKFYLAQTLKDTEQFEESIVWYNKRVKAKGWIEEVYYSKFQIGINNEHLGMKKQHCLHILAHEKELTEQTKAFFEKWNKTGAGPEELRSQVLSYFRAAEEAYLDAYKYRPTRAEALFRLVRLLRLQGKHQEAFDWAVAGNKIVYPKEDSLFIEAACYDYLFDFEIAITASHLSEKKDLGREIVSKLLKRTDLPKQYAEGVQQISRSYL